MTMPLLSWVRSLYFVCWNMRKRLGQLGPITLVLVLLLGTVQTSGMIHDVSSVVTLQQIAHNWRYPYDLLIRPASAVSVPERRAGWVDPQSVLENYGGISPQQVNTISHVSHVTQIVPLANQGWQGITLFLPVILPSQGIYRISAQWNVGSIHLSSVVTTRYVEVTDLAHLTNEIPVSYPQVQYVLMKGTPVTYTMPLQADQLTLRVPSAEEKTLQRIFTETLPDAHSVHLSLHVEQLGAARTLLPYCMAQIGCWQAIQARQGTIFYQETGTQLVRYSPVHYAANSQQLASGQVGIDAVGNDENGLFYRTQLPVQQTGLQKDARIEVVPQPVSALDALPFSTPERLPLFTNAIHLLPLTQQCVVSDTNCYSSLYVRVSGVDQYSQRSLALLQATAATITARTGLHVDILDGSSLRSLTLISSATSVQATWLVIGVAVQIVQGVNSLQAMLLILCILVCLLAIVSAALLVGTGKRQEVVLLQQVGWTRSTILVSLFCDGFLLCIPGCVVYIAMLMWSREIWQSTLDPAFLMILLGIGVLAYCSSLVLAALSEPLKTATHKNVSWKYLMCSLTITCAVFLIAIEYIMTTNFAHTLIITVLGKQVQAALDTPQLYLTGLMICVALFTVGLCMTLLLRGRRAEWRLLAILGWERRMVMLRILHESWRYALISGEVGAVLALLAVLFTSNTVSFSFLPVGMVLVWGPLAGIVIVSIALLWPTYREIERAFRWK